MIAALIGVGVSCSFLFGDFYLIDRRRLKDRSGPTRKTWQCLKFQPYQPVIVNHFVHMKEDRRVNLRVAIANR
jgi:hypothetical protein